MKKLLGVLILASGLRAEIVFAQICTDIRRASIENRAKNQKVHRLAQYRNSQENIEVLERLQRTKVDLFFMKSRSNKEALKSLGLNPKKFTDNSVAALRDMLVKKSKFKISEKFNYAKDSKALDRLDAVLSESLLKINSLQNLNLNSTPLEQRALDRLEALLIRAGASVYETAENKFSSGC